MVHSMCRERKALITKVEKVHSLVRLIYRSGTNTHSYKYVVGIAQSKAHRPDVRAKAIEVRTHHAWANPAEYRGQLITSDEQATTPLGWEGFSVLCIFRTAYKVTTVRIFALPPPPLSLQPRSWATPSRSPTRRVGFPDAPFVSNAISLCNVCLVSPRLPQMP